MSEVKWFDVKKTLPSGSDLNRKVLIVLPGLTQPVIGWVNSNGEWVRLDTRRECRPSHWAELPDPPKTGWEPGDTPYRTKGNLVALVQTAQLFDGKRQYVGCAGFLLNMTCVWDESGKCLNVSDTTIYDLTPPGVIP